MKIRILVIVAFQTLSLLFCSSCEMLDLFEVFANSYGGSSGGGNKHWNIIPGGLATNVSGQFYNYNTNSPIANLRLYIAEYIDDPVLDLTFSRYIDSILTDQNGNFEIPFVTTGAGVQYQLSIKWPDVNWWGYYKPPLVIEQMGTNNVINVQMAELSILEAKIKVVDNLHPPLIAVSDYGSFHELYEVNKDSTIFLRVMPNRKNRIFFFISVDTVSNYYYREQPETINMECDFSDTIKAEFELHPLEFKRRTRLN